MQQGYVTLATGAEKYVEMAKYLAMSVKLNDKRPISLITDAHTKISPEAASWFDQIIVMESKDGYVGCLNKLRVYDYSPYTETMFLDSDCLIAKQDMNRHWQKFARDGFNIAGDTVINGQWYNFDIAHVLSTLNIQFMVKMNSGVFYFKKGKQASDYFDTCNRLVEQSADLLACSHRHQTQLADEPFIGAAMGVHNLEPVSYTPQEGSIMITTVYARDCLCDPVAHISQIKKPSGFKLLNRFFPKSLVEHSPSVWHFVKLKPEKVYLSACKALDLHFKSKDV